MNKRYFYHNMLASCFFITWAVGIHLAVSVESWIHVGIISLLFLVGCIFGSKLWTGEEFAKGRLDA